MKKIKNEMKENQLSRFALEKHLNEHPDDNVVIVSKFLWEFKKTSIQKEMGGELTTLCGFPTSGDIFETVGGDVEVLMVGYWYVPPKTYEEVIIFSDGNVQKTEKDKKEYASLLDHSITVASQTLEHYSGHYKTELKQEHIQDMRIRTYFHNLESEIGKECFRTLRRDDFSRESVKEEISMNAEEIFSNYTSPTIN